MTPGFDLDYLDGVRQGEQLLSQIKGHSPGCISYLLLHNKRSPLNIQWFKAALISHSSWEARVAGQLRWVALTQGLVWGLTPHLLPVWWDWRTHLQVHPHGCWWKASVSGWLLARGHSPSSHYPLHQAVHSGTAGLPKSKWSKRERENDQDWNCRVFSNLTSQVTPSVLPHLTGHTDQPWRKVVGEGLYKTVNPRRTYQWGPPLSLANTQKAKKSVLEKTSQHPLPLMAQCSVILFSVQVCPSQAVRNHAFSRTAARGSLDNPCPQTSIKMAPIKKTKHAKCWWGYRVTGTLVHCWHECKTVQSFGKTVHPSKHPRPSIARDLPRRKETRSHNKTCI